MRDREPCSSLQYIDAPVGSRPDPNVLDLRCSKVFRRLLPEHAKRGHERLGGPTDRHGAGAMAFAELLVEHIHSYWNMLVARLCITEQALQPYLSGSRLDQVDAAHDFGDALQAIVHYHGQLVGNQAVTPTDNEVARLGLETL